jgi:aconitate hydratase
MTVEGEQITYYRLARLADAGLGAVDGLPYSIKVLLEAVVRAEDGHGIGQADVANLAGYDAQRLASQEVPFQPSRVLLQDFTGVPAVVDLAAMRSAMARLGGDPQRINPQIPVDLVVDHSVQVDRFGEPDAERENSRIEFERNRERYEFLHWGQKAFQNFRVVPPSSGICHQVNLEYLAHVVGTRRDGDELVAYPDTLVGTDSHTPMVNGLGVVGWGVGGIEAEAAMLGQPLYMVAPAVVGVRLVGELPERATATDLVLRVTELLRSLGVVGKFVEFFGPALSELAVTDRATIANMAPEYGATMGYFPVDDQTLDYLRATGREEKLVQLVERYCKEQGLFRRPETPTPSYQQEVELNLSDVEPSLAGPRRPQDRIPLGQVSASFRDSLTVQAREGGFQLTPPELGREVPVALGEGREASLGHGAVVIAAITSCTNTSNPAVMMAAGLVAKKAVEAGLDCKPWVKTSLAPGSRVVTDYLDRAGLSTYLDQLGFHTVGYGCTTCIGNSGPLPPAVAQAVEDGQLVAAAVLSGNRNFEGRINPLSRANYLASPPLVVAYALAGSVSTNLQTEPLGTDREGQPVFLRDLWPRPDEVAKALEQAVGPELFRKGYEGIEQSNPRWNEIPGAESDLFAWAQNSTYIQEPPFFVDLARQVQPLGPLSQARVLALLGDSVTTDHISPAGVIPASSPAGEYLQQRGVGLEDFNSFGSRRGNDRVMTRGTFGNIRLRNQLAPGTEGGFTTHLPTGEVTSIYTAACRYQEAGTPTIVVAGKDYGMGSSRDWAAKGTLLLGVVAVVAESYERIHRSNLAGMGVLPLQFRSGESAASLGLTGHETFAVELDNDLQPNQELTVTYQRDDGTSGQFSVTCRLDTPIEVDYYRHGGILPYVVRRLAVG